MVNMNTLAFFFCPFFLVRGVLVPYFAHFWPWKINRNFYSITNPQKLFFLFFFGFGRVVGVWWAWYYYTLAFGCGGTN
jgi:hypothetical protein